MKKIVLLIGIALSMPLAGHAQVAVSAQTTLPSAVGKTDTDIPVASAAGITAGLLGFVDSELFRVESIAGTTLRTTRGIGGVQSAHASATTVRFGGPGLYHASDPVGPCSAPAAWLWINTANAVISHCSSLTWANLNGGGGGGGVSSSAFYTTVGASATPTFTVTASSSLQTFNITLTANVISSTLDLTAATAGQDITFNICDTAGGHTFAWPSNVTGAGVVVGEAGTCSLQTFRYDGTNAVAATGLTCPACSPAETIPGSTSGVMLIKAPATGGGTVTGFAGSDTMVGQAVTQPLTNKTYNKVTITPPATSSTLTVPDGVTFTGPPASGTAATLGLNETLSGDKTFTGAVTHAGATHTTPAKTGVAGSKPATCTTGEEYFATDATAGQNKYYCTATNTWTQQLNTGGGGGGSAFDPLDTTSMAFTDWFASCRTSLNAGAGVGAIGCGNHPFLIVNDVTNSIITTFEGATANDSDGNHPSAVKLELSGTVANAEAHLFPLYNNATLPFRPMYKSWDIRWVLYVSNITTMSEAVGLCSSRASALKCNDEVFIKFDPAVDSHWGLITCTSSGTCDTQVSTTITATTGYHNIKFSFDQSLTKYTVVIDGTTKTLCASGCDITTSLTHVPATTVAMKPALMMLNNGTITGPTNYIEPVFFGFKLSGLVM